MKHVLIGVTICFSTIKQYVEVSMDLFLIIFATAHSDKYALVCGIKAYHKMHEIRPTHSAVEV